MQNIFLSSEDKSAVFKNFETKMSGLRHSYCCCCRMVAIGLVVRQPEGRCSRCLTKPNDYYLEKNALPIWYDENNEPQFHLPDELLNLTPGEKMLIQRATPLISLRHIKNGIKGIKGHVCCYPNDLPGWTATLPRLPTDSSVIYVLRKTQTEIGGTEIIEKPFMVRRKKVLDALRWLQKYNREYKDINILESNLNWFEGEEGALDTQISIDNDMETHDDLNEMDDPGPCPNQTRAPTIGQDDIQCVGVLTEDAPPILSENDKIIQEKLREASATAKRKGNDKIFVDLPTIKPKPLAEHDPLNKIFCWSFPWLFPGGIGDHTDFPIDEKYRDTAWGRMILFYQDGRFMRDELFCFFAMNFVIRRLNSSSGRYFTNKFYKGGSTNLEDLQEAIENGDTNFVNCVTYYASRVKGSNPYWISKRSELYTWINHHVQSGNGPPVYFITLTCAEYQWADIVDIIRDRVAMEGGDPKQVDRNKPGFVQLVNQYALVVQEYFQHKVTTWLDTVGKELLGIEHYWIRYEFTPGRGQIHAHLLATSQDRFIYPMMARAWQRDKTGKLREQRLAHWASNRFGMTASVREGFDEIDKSKITNPTTLRFTDIADDPVAQTRDTEHLKYMVEIHDCSANCLRKPRSG